MARHRFGLGEYRYFDHPLPPPVAELREALYAPLAEIANRWAGLLGDRTRFPAGLDDFLALCHRKGQRRPTPLMLRYETGGHNTLHQDVYGEVTFPLQVVIGLSAPGEDYTGGELVVVEQRPRSQARATAITLARGEGVLIATREKPARGARGHYRASLRHGVSTVTSGTRSTLGIIFHDAP
ncbi:MAG: proline hydroxylase [Chloroflexi bacterium]|nr:MAG: proline hydroxylase [Chloroflexota bacterium]